MNKQDFELIIDNIEILEKIINNPANITIFGKKEEFEMKVQELGHFIYIGALLSHYFYSLWSIIMFESS